LKAEEDGDVVFCGVRIKKKLQDEAMVACSVARLEKF
jgi:hypothetical protein